MNFQYYCLNCKKLIIESATPKKVDNDCWNCWQKERQSLKELPALLEQAKRGKALRIKQDALNVKVKNEKLKQIRKQAKQGNFIKNNN